MNINEIKNFERNPRMMTDTARRGLKKSLKEFGDISGILVSKRTKEIISGNHRFEEVKKLYEGQTLTLSRIEDTDNFFIYAGKKNTSFIIRFVDWDDEKSIAANLTANNQNIQGYFTNAVDDLLFEIKDFEPFSEINLQDLYINIPLPDILENEESKLFDDTYFEDVNDDFREILDDTDFGEVIEIEEEETKDIITNKAEVHIMLEGEDINLTHLNNDIKKFLEKKYKIAFLTTKAY